MCSFKHFISFNKMKHKYLKMLLSEENLHNSAKNNLSYKKNIRRLKHKTTKRSTNNIVTFSCLEMMNRPKRPEKEGFSLISTSFLNGEPLVVSTSSGSRALSICLVAQGLWYGVTLTLTGSRPTAKIRSRMRRGAAECQSPSIW